MTALRDGQLVIGPLVAVLSLVLGPVTAWTETGPGTPDDEVPEQFEVCLSCHAYRPDDPPLEAPSLRGVVGRRIASVEGYEYSPALRKVQGVWDRATLDRFLASPQAFAPGINMTFGGVRSPADRAVVIDFLETLVAPPGDEAPGQDSH